MPSPSVTLLRTQSDSRLVALAAAGHDRAFEAIVERYRRALLRHARRYLPDARAEDAVQQALVAAWTALRRGDEVRELRPWLHRIVHNVALNALRTPGYDYEQLRATLQGDGGPAELAERRAIVRGTLAGLAALPERQREALLRIAVEGRSQDEVAEQLGLSKGAVRALVHRARTALRAAATAVVPLPLASWLATSSAGRTDVALRVGELVAGAGGGATLAKAGAVAVLAGGAVAAPAVVHDVSDRDSRAVAESPTRPDAKKRARAAATPAGAPVLADAPDDDAAAGGEGQRPPDASGERRAGGADDEGGRGEDDHRGPGRRDGDERPRRGDDADARRDAPRSRRDDRGDDDRSHGDEPGGAQRRGDDDEADDGGYPRHGREREDDGGAYPRHGGEREDDGGAHERPGDEGDDDGVHAGNGDEGDDDAQSHDGDGRDDPAAPPQHDGVPSDDDSDGGAPREDSAGDDAAPRPGDAATPPQDDDGDD